MLLQRTAEHQTSFPNLTKPAIFTPRDTFIFFPSAHMPSRSIRTPFSRRLGYCCRCTFQFIAGVRLSLQYFIVTWIQMLSLSVILIPPLTIRWGKIDQFKASWVTEFTSPRFLGNLGKHMFSRHHNQWIPEHTTNSSPLRLRIREIRSSCFKTLEKKMMGCWDGGCESHNERKWWQARQR